MRFLLLLSDRKVGSSLFLHHRFLRKVRFLRTPQGVLLRRIPPMSRVPVPPPLRFSGTFPSRPVQFVLHRCPSYVSSTHGVVLFFCSVLRVRFCLFPSLNTHG